MKFIPILFSTPMVQAILDDRKTMTRRVFKTKDVPFLKLENSFVTNDNAFGWVVKHRFAINPDRYEVTQHFKCPYGQPGDVLWVRESFRKYYLSDEHGYFNYDNLLIDFATDNPEMIPQTDGDGFQVYNKNGIQKYISWKPGIHMPKAACRIFLEITNVRAERLHDISEADAIAEGIESFRPVPGDGPAQTLYKHYLIDKYGPSPVHSFQTLWQKINGMESWNTETWVWVIEFKRIERPLDFC